MTLARMTVISALAALGCLSLRDHLYGTTSGILHAFGFGLWPLVSVPIALGRCPRFGPVRRGVCYGLLICQWCLLVQTGFGVVSCPSPPGHELLKRGCVDVSILLAAALFAGVRRCGPGVESKSASS